MKQIILIILSLAFCNVQAKEVGLIKINGGIGPAVNTYLERAIEDSQNESYEALIIQLNTPGGLLESTRDIVGNIMDSEVPIIVYVSPSGSRAGSAGVFITMAANVAFMAPGTNMGSAHPVGMGGEMGDSASVMSEKVTNDAAAFIRTIAQKRGRNEEWAERAVRESISGTAIECYDAGVIDFIAPSLDSLLVLAEGLIVETPSGEELLEISEASIVELEMDWKEEFLLIISDPNVAYIFIILAIYGVFFELYNPGSIFPGVIGGISAILAAYSLQMLPVNYVGVAFMIAAIISFILEAFISSYGLLSIGGVVSFVLGSIMLIDSPLEFMEISNSLIATGTIVTAVFFIWIVTMGIKAQFRKDESGDSGFVGEKGVCTNEIVHDLSGLVKIHGEIWKARSNQKISVNEDVIVEKVDGMVLWVKKID